jgi:ATP-dependent DNA helicase RecG
MTATPIPRTMLLASTGGLAISNLLNKPKNRKSIKSKYIGYDGLINKINKKIKNRIEEEIKKENQIFIVCPAISETYFSSRENIMTIKGVEKIYKKNTFKNVKFSITHNKKSKEENKKEFEKFFSKETQILISTSKIEVGIDIPNATVIVIESADRFGSAQLHQLRGRVGRSDKKSYCFVINYNDQQKSSERLREFCKLESGFDIAKMDSKNRGSGNIDGTKQSGEKNRIFKIFDSDEDSKMIPYAQKEAKKIIREDPEILNKDNVMIKKYITTREDKFLWTITG